MTLIPSDAAQLLHADSRQDTVVVLTTTKREEMQTFSGEKGYEMNREGEVRRSLQGILHQNQM
jgi:hypothetical protein